MLQVMRSQIATQIVELMSNEKLTIAMIYGDGVNYFTEGSEDKPYPYEKIPTVILGVDPTKAKEIIQKCMNVNWPYPFVKIIPLHEDDVVVPSIIENVYLNVKDIKG